MHSQSSGDLWDIDGKKNKQQTTMKWDKKIMKKNRDVVISSCEIDES